MRKAMVGVLLTMIMVVAAAVGAGADPALSGDGYAFGGTITLADEEVLPPTPEAAVSGTGDDADEALIEVPVDPLAFNGTLNAEAHVHQAADLDSFLTTHTTAGPYNAQALGQVEDLEVLIDAVAADVPLVNASAVTGEVVAKCVGDTVEYSADSEIVDLDLATSEEIGDALDELLGTLFPGLDPLDPVLNIEEGVITELDDGLAIDALVVTVLDAANPGAGVVQARFGHAELSGVACGELPECSDTADNDGDGVIDAQDPGCHTDGNPDNPDSYNPDDDDESDGECADRVDNDTDGTTDFDDPDCHTDGDPKNPDSYDPNRTENTKRVPRLPRTGSPIPVGAAAGLAGLGLALTALRRRTIA
ncbi:MAG: hypothetical protein Q8K58_10360 [Acidimicrobiales bacterium]|nr:hypothetical protein [Acidimicrobiales bacterium]